MMSYLVHYVLLLTSFGGVFSGRVLARQGELVLLFGNADYMTSEVALYIWKYKNHTHIVTWTIKNEFTLAGWTEKKYSKIFMDSNRNIMISDVDENYQGKYSINTSNSINHEVELTILEERLTLPGETVLLFSNVDDPDEEVSLCISENKSDTLIVTWMINDKNMLTKWMVKKYHKIYMDTERNIKIHSVDENYERKYFIPNSSRPGVELIILDKSSYLESDITTTVLPVIIAWLSVMLITIIIISVIHKIKNVIREEDIKFELTSHDISLTGHLLSKSSPDSAEDLQHSLWRMMNNERRTKGIQS